MSSSFFIPDKPIGSSYQDFGGAGPGIFSGSNGSSNSSGGGRNKFREALMAASKYKSETDYKAEKEAEKRAKEAEKKAKEDKEKRDRFCAYKLQNISHNII